MNKRMFILLENYMLSCMKDSAHDKEHIYRVLYQAIEIAQTERNVDYDVLISACLLHDIGRKEQYEDPSVCHAAIGGEKAYRFLVEHGFSAQTAEHIRHCIETHRFRKDNIPQTMEAKILFDADKLDATGAMGIARTLLYQGLVSEPLYSIASDGSISDGAEDKEPSFFREYRFKLEKLYSQFYTKKAAEIAQARQSAARDFYDNLLKETTAAYGAGKRMLESALLGEI